MNMRELALKVCEREGKKVQLTIGQVNEVLAVLSDIIHEQGEEKQAVFALLERNGERRAKRRERKAQKGQAND